MEKCIFRKKVICMACMFVMFMSVTVYASSGFYGKSLTIKNSNFASSSTGANSTGTARVDVNTLSDTAGYKYVRCFIQYSNGSISSTYNIYAQNTKFYSVSTGNVKAVFKRAGSTSGTTTMGYNFVYNY